MPKDPAKFAYGFKELSSYLDSLYNDLDVLADKSKSKPNYGEIKKANQFYKSTLRKFSVGLGKSISNFNKTVEDLNKLAEKDKGKIQKAYVKAIQPVIQISANLYPYLDPKLDIINFIGMYAQMGFSKSKFKKGSDILEKYYLEPEDIKLIAKEVKVQKKKAAEQVDKEKRKAA